MILGKIMVCPRCDNQGLLHKAQVMNLNKKLVICEECDACWSEEHNIKIDNFMDLTVWLENNGLVDTEVDIKILGYIEPNSGELQRTFFNVADMEAIELIDEAWLMKDNPLPHDRGTYLINMKRVIGTEGETGIKIIVKPGTAEIKTAYPVMLKE